MRALKIISGLGCLVAACFLGVFAWISFIWGELWFKFIPIIFAIGLVTIGFMLIFKQRSPFSSRARGLIAAYFGLFLLLPVVLVFHIRHDRSNLQARAKAFLERPIPKLLVPDSDGYVGEYYVDTNSGPQNGVFGYSTLLIERYATKGRIRWSARIQGQFACTSEGVNANILSEAINTNEEVRLYLAEHKAILGKEWRMGFWQWIEDAIEMKDNIPEHEEEDYPRTVATNSVSR